MENRENCRCFIQRQRDVIEKINYVNFFEKKIENLLLNQTKPSGDEFATLFLGISIELMVLMFFFRREGQ